MKKPYAESTLKRKYKETGIEPERIMKAQAYLTACANFYKIIEIKDVWKVIGKKCGVTKTEFDALLPIFSRDGSLSFYIERDDEFYSDGTEELLLIDMVFLIVANDDFEIEQFNHAMEQDEEYDGPEPLEEDWDLFFELDKQRIGKPLFIPADILRYADEDYIEETPQVKAMRHFLESEIKLDEETIAPGDDGRTPAEEASWWAVVDMNDIILDLSVPMVQSFSKALECLEEIGYHILDVKQTQRFLDLFTDMSNNTRMPSNRGFTPNEMTRRSGGGMPTSISFGPGLRQSIQSGELNGEEMKRAFMGEAGLPLEVRTNLMREVDSALKPGEEKWIGGTLVKGEKIRPNDPCPCGSGKKYKKCCGKKTYNSNS